MEHSAARGGASIQAAITASAAMLPGTEPVFQARTQVQALHELLLFMFDASEFRIWLRFNAESEAVLRGLPGESVSKADLMLKAIDLLSRRGLIHAEFFDRLREYLPRQAAVIEHVCARWLGKDPVPGMFQTTL